MTLAIIRTRGMSEFTHLRHVMGNGRATLSKGNFRQISIHTLLTTLSLIVISLKLIFYALRETTSSTNRSSTSKVRRLRLITIHTSRVNITISFTIHRNSICFRLVINRIPKSRRHTTQSFRLFIILCLSNRQALFHSHTSGSTTIFQRRKRGRLL